MKIDWEKCEYYILKEIDRNYKCMSKIGLHNELENRFCSFKEFLLKKKCYYIKHYCVSPFICIEEVSLSFKDRERLEDLFYYRKTLSNIRSYYLNRNNICNYCHKKFKTWHYLSNKHNCLKNFNTELI